MIPLFFQTFFYAQSYHNNKMRGGEFLERWQGVRRLAWLDGRSGEVGMGECDLDGSSRLHHHHSRFTTFFDDIFFSRRGWVDGWDGARWELIGRGYGGRGLYV
jgi:hypothetical protein